MTDETAAPMRFAVPPLDPAALAGLDPAARIVDLAGETMGTSWHVRLAAPPVLDLPGLNGAIQTRLDHLVEQMSHWLETSLLMRFNHARSGSWTSLPDDFARVIAASLTIAEQTDGAFSPAVGRLTDLHGLGPNVRTGLPGAADLAAALGASDWRRLAFDGPARRLRQPGGLWLDLSGVAKGYAVDAVAALLGAHGVRHALVEIGGECVGRGMRPDGDPWWVELETPPGLALPPIRVALHQLAVATSGNYVRGDHTLDPRTGQPVRNGIVSASVIHASAMLADAWATALTVLGPDEGAAFAAREGLTARLVIAEDDAAREWLSPELERMVTGD